VRKISVTIGLLLAAVLVVAFSVPALAVSFDDVDGHPYEASIFELADRGIIGGYANSNSFGPDDLVTRQQFAKMIVKTLDLEVTGNETCPFVDVTPGLGIDPLYPANYIAVCALNNITKGKDATHFAPYENITRQQVVTMVVRAADNLAAGTLEDPAAGWSGVLTYGDAQHGTNIKKAEFNGLLDGIWASNSAPGLSGWQTAGFATRGEVAEMLAQLLYRTGSVLTLSGPSGARNFTMAELRALPATEGYGGWKNVLGNITGPMVWKGVAIHTLMDLVGGGSALTVIASDGYEAGFDSATVNGVLTVYDPSTGAEIPAYSGTITMILAYAVNDEDLPSDFGALRIAFVSSTPDQVTYSANWARQVSEIEVE